jgi:hypothetical protein
MLNLSLSAMTQAVKKVIQRKDVENTILWQGVELHPRSMI